MSSTTALRPDLTPTVDLRRPPFFLPALPMFPTIYPSLTSACASQRYSSVTLFDPVRGCVVAMQQALRTLPRPIQQPLRSTTVAVRQPDGVTAKATALASRFHGPGALGGHRYFDAGR